jgi:hypothetical protein
MSNIAIALTAFAAGFLFCLILGGAVVVWAFSDKRSDQGLARSVPSRPAIP